MLPLRPNPALTSCQALRKATRRRLARETLCFWGRREGFSISSHPLNNTPHLLFCRQAWRPKPTSSRLSPTTPRGTESVSFPKREGKKEKQSQKEKLKLQLLCLKAPGRKETGLAQRHGRALGAGNLCAETWKTLSAGKL